MLTSTPHTSNDINFQIATSTFKLGLNKKKKNS